MSERDVYLTVGDDPKGRGLLAIVSRGHPQQGDAQCTVLSVEVVKNMKAAKAWFRRVKIEQPWEIRQ